MQKTNLIQVARFALHPRRFKLLAKKLLKRFERGSQLPQAENLRWIAAHCEDFSVLANSLDEGLWAEAREFSRALEQQSRAVLVRLGYPMGGAGCYPLLYFLARRLKPECIVETGVAAGFTSQAFLCAIERNGGGHLFSSDLPYFRLPHPERLIGAVVDERLKRHWSLLIEGDERNLPIIFSRTGAVDLFHYDSDKSYSGRAFALSLVEKRLSRSAVMVMDDIQDNSFFHDYISSRRPACWHVFEFEGKFIGVVGDLGKPVEEVREGTVPAG